MTDKVTVSDGSTSVSDSFGEYNTVSFGLAGGLGYDFNCGAFLDFQMQRELTTLVDKDKLGERLYPYGFSFIVGYRF